jgi:tetratricopeptide (TPR) repeat protein
MTQTAAQLLSRFSIGYDTLLERARRWRIGDNDGQKKEAIELLKGLRQRYPLALQIRQELALARMDVGQRDLAERELGELRAMVRNPNEELLCRLGRMLKDDGDWLNPYLPAELKHRSEGEGRQANAEQAESKYLLSQDYYDEAYQVRPGGHYPGINKATLLLVRASLVWEMGERERAAGLREAAAQLARELLDRRSKWSMDQPDDPTVWHPATAAEAHLLLREWRDARELYRTIPRNAGHRDTIERQIQRILTSWDLMGVKERGECQSVETIFQLPGKPGE